MARSKITVRDRGPLVASLLVESDAPGCHKLVREIRLVAGADYVELLEHGGQEAAGGGELPRAGGQGERQLRLSLPRARRRRSGSTCRSGVIRPETDQMPSACKNWLTVGRWADVANADFGVTWVTLDAPLVQVGGITATLLNSQTNPDVWRKKIEPTQKLYSWAMNNHWGTNYRAYQEGPVVFRFVLRPHRGPCSDAEASRFATDFSQPLVAVPGRGNAPDGTSLLRVEPADVIVSGLKPSDDGKALIVRLLCATDKPVNARLNWPRAVPQRLWISDTSEQPIREVRGDVLVPAWGMVTLRADLPQ